MKKIIYTLTLGFLFSLTSCEVDYSELEFKEAPFVYFETTSFNDCEGTSAGSSIKLKVVRATPDLTESLNVSVSFTAKYASTGADATGTYTAPTSVTIPAAKSSADLVITSIPNAVIDGDKVITVTLTNAGSLNLGYPGVAGSNKISTVTFKDEDAITFSRSLFLGNYSCDEPGYGVYSVTFNTDTDPNTIVNSNFWNERRAIKYVLDPVNGTVTIPSQVSGSRTISSTTTGIFQLCSGKMVVPYKVVIGGSEADNNVHTFTK
jgi:hypothetical protein